MKTTRQIESKFMNSLQYFGERFIESKHMDCSIWNDFQFLTFVKQIND